jgi:hypothetical protein
VRGADNLATFIFRLPKNVGGPNLLEPYVPVEASTGIALPLPFIKKMYQCHVYR